MSFIPVRYGTPPEPRPGNRCCIDQLLVSAGARSIGLFLIILFDPLWACTGVPWHETRTSAPHESEVSEHLRAVGSLCGASPLHPEEGGGGGKSCSPPSPESRTSQLRGRIAGGAVAKEAAWAALRFWDERAVDHDVAVHVLSRPTYGRADHPFSATDSLPRSRSQHRAERRECARFSEAPPRCPRPSRPAVGSTCSRPA